MSVTSYENLLTQIRDDQVKELDLFRSTFGEKRIFELLKELKGNKSVKKVCLSDGSRFASVLCDVLKVNTSITWVDLSESNLGDQGARSIAEALKVNHNVKMLFLGDNNIGNEGARALAEALQVNQFVKELDLENNNIGSDGARAISEALKVNQNLKELNLYRNNICSEGRRALLDGLQINGSLLIFLFSELEVESTVFYKRNVAMHERAAESVVHLLALRKMRKILWIPREMMLMIAQMLWKTKCDVNAWNFEVKKLF